MAPCLFFLELVMEFAYIVRTQPGIRTAGPVLGRLYCVLSSALIVLLSFFMTWFATVSMSWEVPLPAVSELFEKSACFADLLTEAF